MSLKRFMLVIGLTGTKAGGKGEVAEFLKSKGFICYILSDILKKELVQRGKEKYSVRDLQDMGNELREKHGPGILAKMTAEKIQEDLSQGREKFVIDGIRNPGEVEELKKLNFYLISVDAPQKRRFEFTRKRGKVSDYKSWEEFLEVDMRDKGKGEPGAGQQVALCMELADFNVFNDSTIEALHIKIQEILDSLGRQ
jgi:dephospho-CoA kinase